MVLFTDGKEVIVKNRHKQSFSNFKMDMDELRRLHRGTGWMVLVGEYMNKNQKDETGKHWNIKFVIFDIIVYEGVHKLNSSFQERQDLLNRLYKSNQSKLYLDHISDNVYRVQNLYSDFHTHYRNITKIDMFEGFVLKKISGKLEQGTRENNNTRTQLKCRKETKNYNF